MTPTAAADWDPDVYAATLRALLARLGITQARLAHWSGLRPPQISRWVSGTSRPGYDAVRALRRAVLERAPLDAEILGLLDQLGAAAGYDELAGGAAEVDAAEVEYLNALGLGPDDTALLIQIRRTQIHQLYAIVHIMRARQAPRPPNSP